MPTIAIVGASNDHSKFGSKAVRAYLKRGWTVHPVHPQEELIEGLAVHRSVAEIGAPLDRVTLYVPPPVGVGVVRSLAGLDVKELFLNPGTESDEVAEAAEEIGLPVVSGCAIVDIGESPGSY